MTTEAILAWKSWVYSRASTLTGVNMTTETTLHVHPPDHTWAGMDGHHVLPGDDLGDRYFDHVVVYDGWDDAPGAWTWFEDNVLTRRTRSARITKNGV